ncbi:hypothetical protein [uncultured Succinivibrio sp.]|uniref:hypothetical protein n=1 Tax=uncultured Succinivibrio sp. TaxID=540749 RepID=UPI0025D21736|nr:hypothetical protein [uncultured Succinivibrio sp.]
MKHLKINASEYYRVHCKKIFESSYTKEKDCSLNLTPKAEARMTAAFNLLFNYMPAALVPYMQYAANVAPELYNNMQTLADVNLYSKVKFEKMDETKLNAVSRLSSSNTNQLRCALLEAAQTSETLVEKLINRKNSNLLCVIENKMQLSVFPNIIGPADDVSKRKTLAYMLVKVGSTKHLISKLTGTGSKTIKDLYETVLSENLRPMRRYKAADNDTNFGISHLIKVCSNKQFSNQIMLMLSMYTICSRILLNKLPTSNHFDQEDIGEKMSLPLAIGVYRACFDLCRNFNRLYPVKVKKPFEFAFFDDFFTALEIFVSKQAEVVACEDCHTPYLNLYTRKGIRTPVLASENDDFFASKKISFCPSCKCEFEYSLYD